MTHPFEILFSPIPIGPVVAPNRFYQVPHCNGMGYRMPRALASMRGMKAEGGWGVVCTEEVEIHHSSDLAPNIEGRLWDDQDIPGMALMVDAVHQHGALAGIELAYHGHHAANLFSRSVGLGVRSVGVTGYHPTQTRRVDKADLGEIRHWHRAAAIRAKRAGFDIIYCYAAHSLSLAMHLLLRRYNQRTDEYGGNLENRVRFLRELIEDTKDAVGDSCAVAVRLAVEELLGDDGITQQGEGYEIIAMLAELPDLWDVNLSDWSNDSATSRFDKEGFQESYISFVKNLTSKPVVGVGRYTSPESMVSVIERGVMDLIGAARPSIADPFLPIKIREQRYEEIRECIGCNICAAADELSIPIRCTQNPTMGEEWRRGWHPEIIQSSKTEKHILIVGAGPAGLECARVLGSRGFQVTLLEARRELGGRVALESQLPGLSEWRRVVDWRITQLEKLSSVLIFPGSRMSANDIMDTGIRNIIIATGAKWRQDGVGRSVLNEVEGYDQSHVHTPDDIMTGFHMDGKVVIYDDDHYYMGSVIAELLARMGCRVDLVTPAPLAAYWSQYTLEQNRIQLRLMKLGIGIYTQHKIQKIGLDTVRFAHGISGDIAEFPCDHVMLVTDRRSMDGLYRSLKPEQSSGYLESLQLVGDALAPRLIADAVFSGHQIAREFEQAKTGETPFRREFAL